MSRARYHTTGRSPASSARTDVAGARSRLDDALARLRGLEAGRCPGWTGERREEELRRARAEVRDARARLAERIRIARELEAAE